MKTDRSEPGLEFYEDVKKGLRLKGTHAKAFLLARGLTRKNGYVACLGKRNGDKAKALRRDMADAAGVPRPIEKDKSRTKGKRDPTQLQLFKVLA